MAIRNYFCDFIGDGTEGNEYRPVIDNYTQEWSAVDLRADGTGPGKCILRTDVNPPTHNQIIQEPSVFFIDLPGQNIKQDPNWPTVRDYIESLGIPIGRLAIDADRNRLIRRIRRRGLVSILMFTEDLTADEMDTPLRDINKSFNARCLQKGLPVQDEDLTGREAVQNLMDFVRMK